MRRWHAAAILLATLVVNCFSGLMYVVPSSVMAVRVICPVAFSLLFPLFFN